MSSILETPSKQAGTLKADCLFQRCVQKTNIEYAQAGTLMVRDFIIRAICRQSSNEGMRKKVIWDMGPEGVASVRPRKEQSGEEAGDSLCY